MTILSALDSNNPINVTIDGIEVCTEEAAILFESLSTQARSQYQGMTDLQIVKSIYSCPIIGFNYF